MNTPSLDQVKQVFEQWSLYDAIIQHNYMRHAELVDRLKQSVNDLPQPFDILDLGCGDSWISEHIFPSEMVHHYHGIDLSEAALNKADSQLAAWRGRTQFTCGDINTFLSEAATESCSIILMSYSLHHLSSEQKRQVLHSAHRVLRQDGHLLWIDLFRQDQEDRDTYLRRLCNHIRTDWTALTPEQNRQAVDHVNASDFPESEGWMQTETKQAGLSLSRCIYQDVYFGAWDYQKSASES
ncbi:MAG: class I SAM-dependent methyltransferase [Planctomycetaceae bacterium]|nr:class I SAM-dependent methyltransferase [Planctomycetaceae bacterium]